jgi:hypothetical protein
VGRRRESGRRAAAPPEHTLPGSTEDWAGADYAVRPVTGAAATKTYRCPGCDHEIRPATPHVVAWPADHPDAAAYRRHWHTACWRARGRRASKVHRSKNAPRYG